MKTALIYFNALCFLLIILIVGTIIGSDYVGFLPIELVYDEVCQNHRKVCDESPDSINIAVQLGRLDFVSTGLTILGTAFALAAIFGFLYIRENALIVARLTAKEYMETNMEEFIFARVKAENKRHDLSSFDLDWLEGMDADKMAESYQDDGE